MSLPIRARLTAWYGLLLATIVIALGAFLVLRLKSELRSTIDGEVRQAASSVSDGYVGEGPREFHDTAATALPRSGALTQVLDSYGNVLFSYGGAIAERPMAAARARLRALAGTPVLETARLGRESEHFRVMSEAVRLGSRREVVVVAESLDEVDDAVRRVVLLLLFAGPAALAATALGGWWLARRALLPVERMRRKAEQIGIDQLHERLTVPRATDELSQLAVTLNAMLDRLEAGVEAKRQLVADASHELRTPLAAMRAELDVSLRDELRTPAERDVLESVREDVDRMGRTVDNLLTLARADEGRLELLRSEVDLDHVIEAVAQPLRALAERKGVRMLLTGESETVEGDPQRLHQALRNLIENAIEFTPPGGEITVSSWRDGDQVGVTVTDNGMGIPSEARSHVFDRFYRADPSRSRESGGSGLGLAICYEIASAHGGRIWVESEEGAGSAFWLALPSRGRDRASRPAGTAQDRPPAEPPSGAQRPGRW